MQKPLTPDMILDVHVTFFVCYHYSDDSHDDGSPARKKQKASSGGATRNRYVITFCNKNSNSVCDHKYYIDVFHKLRFIPVNYYHCRSAIDDNTSPARKKVLRGGAVIFGGKATSKSEESVLQVDSDSDDFVTSPPAKKVAKGGATRNGSRCVPNVL